MTTKKTKTTKTTKTTKSNKQFVQMSGEFGVTSELYRHHIQASITYGNAKSADVVVFSPTGNRAARVEVKSASIQTWIVGKQALQAASHIVWVFVYLPEPADTISPAQAAENAAAAPRYYILSSNQVKDIYEKKMVQAVAARATKAQILSSAKAQKIKDAQGESIDSTPATGKVAAAKDPMIIFEVADVDPGFNQWHWVNKALKG
ncbi:hypothetical protein [Pseudomonas sp. 25 R 14]|uniref:hypothetical protein n=1 Tax=Pseudomonas sp. 25 R 14 TaxID=1844109 RepID=UPI00081BD9D7|nr:hypothetical protein [Pseudomonas sp. 25 R 14]